MSALTPSPTVNTPSSSPTLSIPLSRPSSRLLSYSPPARLGKTLTYSTRCSNCSTRYATIIHELHPDALRLPEAQEVNDDEPAGTLVIYVAPYRSEMVLDCLKANFWSKAGACWGGNGVLGCREAWAQAREEIKEEMQVRLGEGMRSEEEEEGEGERMEGEREPVFGPDVGDSEAFASLHGIGYFPESREGEGWWDALDLEAEDAEAEMAEDFIFGDVTMPHEMFLGGDSVF